MANASARRALLRMSYLTYSRSGATIIEDKPLVWLHGEVKTPPFSQAGRVEAGFLLRRLQQGEALSLPHSRPMPSVGAQCHELRINDGDHAWRIVYRVEPDAIVVLDVFAKTTAATPQRTLHTCQRRLAAYLEAVREKGV